MKTKRKYTKTFIVTLAFLMAGNIVLAEDKSKGSYISGNSNSAAGDYSVEETNDKFYFQGNAFEVYGIEYENSALNSKIAVNTGSENYSYVVIGKDYKLFYESSEEGFGVRKVKFSNPDAHERFDVIEFKEQTILSESKNIDRKEAIELITANLPAMKS